MQLPDSIRATIAREFGSSQAAAVELMLPSENHLAPNPPYERVLLAIIGLADGVVDDIAVYCRAAIADWRDVLYWWETPELAAEGARHMQERLEDDDE